MPRQNNVLILGASYGSLFANKLALAGHNVCMVCLPEEQAIINEQGTLLRIPVKGRDGLVEIRSGDLDGSISATSTEAASPADYDLVVLAMQEPQYSAPAVKTLMTRIASSAVPCMSIMNMPPLAFLARLPGLKVEALRDCYTDPTIWDEFDPALVTLASPDPQAFRPPDEPLNVLQVALPTNFKVARFESDEHTALLRSLQSDIEAIRYEIDGSSFELPVKLKVHDSVWVPLAKWLMLLTGNYRCVQSENMRPIQEAVHSDIDQSRQLYEWVGGVCQSVGAKAEDLVPFDKYANAATSLAKPSSAARALAAGAMNIERVDKLVQSIAAGQGAKHDEVDSIVQCVDGWLVRNRAQKSV